jgi:hypothetical protein
MSFDKVPFDNIVNNFHKSFKIRSKECFYDLKEDPDKIAFQGKCRIFVPAFMAYNIKAYRSKILNKPTYREIFIKCCDDYIKKSGNMNDYILTDLFLPDNNMDNREYDPTRNFNDTFKLMCKPFLLNPNKIYDIEMRMEGWAGKLDDYIKENKINLNIVH